MMTMSSCIQRNTTKADSAPWQVSFGSLDSLSIS